jgi:hypothetical protein
MVAFIAALIGPASGRCSPLHLTAPTTEGRRDLHTVTQRSNRSSPAVGACCRCVREHETSVLVAWKAAAPWSSALSSLALALP